jgi:hypothetical protein
MGGTLEGQEHNVDLAVLAPVPGAFFKVQMAPCWELRQFFADTGL